MSEANLFSWPGPDLRPDRSGAIESVVYGLLPDAFFNFVRDRFVKAVRDKRLRVIQRTQ
mgnify:CR=1 FL=1